MADPWADRIKLYPKLKIVDHAVGNPGTEGSVDSGGINAAMNLGYGLECEIINPSSVGPVQDAPKNPPATWSSGPDNNDYLAKQ